MDRDFALKEIKKGSAYESEELLNIDKEYFLKKMNWKEEKLTEYLDRPEKSHLSYPSEKKLYDLCLKTYNFLKK